MLSRFSLLLQCNNLLFPLFKLGSHLLFHLSPDAILIIPDVVKFGVSLRMNPLLLFQLFVFVSQVQFHIVNATGEHSDILVKHVSGLVRIRIFFFPPVYAIFVFLDLQAVFLLNLLAFLFILGHQLLLSTVCLISQLLDDCLNFTVPLSNHILFKFALAFDTGVLGFLHHLRLPFLLLNHNFLTASFKFYLMLTSSCINLFLWSLTFFKNLFLGSIFHNSDFFF